MAKKPSLPRVPCPVCGRDIFKGATVKHLEEGSEGKFTALEAIVDWLANPECDRLLLVKPRPVATPDPDAEADAKALKHQYGPRDHD